MLCREQQRTSKFWNTKIPSERLEKISGAMTRKKMHRSRKDRRKNNTVNEKHMLNFFFYNVYKIQH